MRHSLQLDQIGPALVRAQAALRPVARSAENPHYHSSYAPFTAVLAEAMRVCAPEGLFLTQGTVEEDTAGLTVETTILHGASGQWVTERVRMPLERATPQGAGSAIKYGCRYGLVALLGIQTDDPDDDGEAAESAPAPRPSRPTTPPPAAKPTPPPVPHPRAETYTGAIPVMPGKAGVFFKDRAKRAWAGEPITEVPDHVLDEARTFCLSRAQDKSNRWAHMDNANVQVIEFEIERRAGRLGRRTQTTMPLTKYLDPPLPEQEDA